MTATFAFTVPNGHVGEALPFQVVVTSLAHRSSSPIDLSSVRLAFGGGLRDVLIEHDSQIDCRASFTDRTVQSYAPSLQKIDSDCLRGSCNLTFPSGSSKVFLLCLLPLYAGRIEVSKIILYVEGEHFDFEFSLSGADCLHQSHRWIPDGHDLFKSETQSERSTIIEVLPKPPKIRIELSDVLKAYFTGENVYLNIHVSNEEDEESDVDIEVSFVDQMSTPPPVLRWVTTQEGTNLPVYENGKGPLKTSLGLMPPSETRHLVLNFQAESETAEHTLLITANYILLSDPDTPVSKVISVDMLLLRPFEANFEFVPQLQENPWPSYFHLGEDSILPHHTDTGDVKATGLSQRWAVKAAIASFASTGLVLEAVDLQLAAPAEQALCTVSPNVGHQSATGTLSPHQIQERHFVMDLQKVSLDDCSTTYFDLQLQIAWHRNAAGASSAITYLHLPELVIPFGEPRVLASKKLKRRESRTLEVNYMIENPSMQVLSFSVTMDASEDFAFSGPKATSVQLIPQSRHVISYDLLPLVRSKWIDLRVKIIDVHWNKMLKVNATGDIKSNKRGISIWIDTEG